jgi:hypothetical protein
MECAPKIFFMPCPVYLCDKIVATASNNTLSLDCQMQATEAMVYETGPQNHCYAFKLTLYSVESKQLGHSTTLNGLFKVV